MGHCFISHASELVVVSREVLWVVATARGVVSGPTAVACVEPVWKFGGPLGVFGLEGGECYPVSGLAEPGTRTVRRVLYWLPRVSGRDRRTGKYVGTGREPRGLGLQAVRCSAVLRRCE